MKARVVAWVVVLGVIYAASVAWSHWKNPWTGSAAIPVASMLPPMTKCSEDCK